MIHRTFPYIPVPRKTRHAREHVCRNSRSGASSDAGRAAARTLWLVSYPLESCHAGLSLEATRGITVSAETMRGWVHEVGWVWKRAKLVAKDDDPHRVDRLARIRWAYEQLHLWEALVFADELDIQWITITSIRRRPSRNGEPSTRALRCSFCRPIVPGPTPSSAPLAMCMRSARAIIRANAYAIWGPMWSSISE